MYLFILITIHFFPTPVTNTVDMINRIYGHLTKDSGDALISIFSASLKASGAKIGLMNKKNQEP